MKSLSNLEKIVQDPTGSYRTPDKTRKIVINFSCECIKAIQSQQNNTVPCCFNLTGKHTSKRVQNSRLDSTITTNACDKNDS